MIQAILIFNNHGKPRLSKFYDFYVSFEIVYSFVIFTDKFSVSLLQPEEEQQRIIRETFQLVSKRDDNVCNFLESQSFLDKNSSPDTKLIYRHYAWVLGDLLWEN